MAETESLILRLDGFEGPLDLLLELARAQKVDLARISVLALVEQFLAVIEGARRIRLELAADWLVMAAWLAWLKSRLLLPEPSDEAETGGVAAELLAERLAALAAVRHAALWLGGRAQLGQDVFPRGAPEDFRETDRSRLLLDQAGLVRAYLAAIRRGSANRRYRTAPPALWSVQDALTRLERMLGELPPDRAIWVELERFLPDQPMDKLQRKAALASTLIAGLELARGGAVVLRQDGPFREIMVRPHAAQ